MAFTTNKKVFFDLSDLGRGRSAKRIGDDAHRPLEKSHELAASLSYVETRQVRSDYTLRWEGKFYQIEREAVRVGLRGANVRVERRLDGMVAVRHGEQYLPIHECGGGTEKVPPCVTAKLAKSHGSRPRASDWNRNFDLHKAPKIWQAAEASGVRREE